MRLHGLTAPIDPRPYAGPGDLVTAADVARWLREWRSAATDRELIAAVDWVHAYDVQDLRNAHDLAQELASQALDARLERERRQACRRGARMNFADAATLMRCYALNRTLGVIRDTASEDAIAHYLTRALAFRAAARQP